MSLQLSKKSSKLKECPCHGNLCTFAFQCGGFKNLHLAQKISFCKKESLCRNCLISHKGVCKFHNLSEYSVYNTLNILEELNIDPQELSQALGRDVFECERVEDDYSSDSSSDGADSDAGDAGAVGGIVTSRLSCTHLNLCSVCLDVCPGCEEVEETGPVPGEVVMRIVYTAPRRQWFPLAA